MQAVQAAHAALEFAVRHPVTVSSWSHGEGSLLLLAASDELALLRLLTGADRDGCRSAPFREPDLGDALTAVAVYGASRLCARYPLALPGGGEKMTPEQEVKQLRAALSGAVDEIDVLKAQVAGDFPAALYWLGKAHRQRSVLDVLNRKLLSLHFALRLMNQLREPLTAAEWKEAREANPLRDRVDEKVPEPA